MTDILRIKRRVTGLAGAPSGLANAEIAYNEVDHILYYGEGTGGTGGTASIIAAIGGQGLAYTLTPAVNSGSGSSGSQGLWARGDHVHPSDGTKANVAGPSFTGTSTFAAISVTGTSTLNGTVTGTGITSLLSPYALLAGPTFTLTATFTNITVGSNAVFSGTLSGAGITAMLAPYAPLVSPSFSGFPVFTVGVNGVTAALSDSSTLLATTAFVKGQVYAAAGSVPTPSSATPAMDGAGAAGSLATYARGDHQHPADTTKANLAGPTIFTGAITLPVATTLASAPVYPTSSLALATTAFVSVNFAPLINPDFGGGIPLANTAGSGTNTRQIATTAFALAVRQDQQLPPTSAVSWGNQQITNLLGPSLPTDAANKAYVDANSAGLVAKGSVQAATTGNIATFPPVTLLVTDGYTPVLNDRILIKDQTLAQNNGIYVVQTPPTAWTRATDMDTWPEVPQAYVFVVNGTVNSNSSWTCNSPLAGGTIGTTAITWVQFSQQASVTAGNGLTRVGNQFSVVGTANRIAVGVGVDIASNYVGQSSINTLGTVVGSAVWNAATITVPFGGTGVATLAAGYVKSNGTSAFTSLAQVPFADVAGLASMASQPANNVIITGGTIDGITFDMGTF